MSPAALVVYDWLTLPGFLVYAVAGSPFVIKAAVQDSADIVLAGVPEGTTHFLFHLNCTRTSRFPVDRANLVGGLDARGIRVLNERATDISKAFLQERCRALGLPSVHTTSDAGTPDDMIMVKSNLNYGGANEWALTAEERDILGVGPGSTMIYEPNHYLVMPRREVEAGWWEDAQLVCERFVGNEDGRWLRAFRFLDRFVLCEMESADQVKKVGSSVLHRAWMIGPDYRESLPDDAVAARTFAEILQLTDDMGVDFGAIDAMVDADGTPYIIDVNTTPAYYSPAPG
ncbi:MAG TPA: hypothetical protein VMZ90_06685, partial [Vicinamibacterales bacterium]|nr:hypothetical protein [Vicinamibacterales bacterium]